MPTRIESALQYAIFIMGFTALAMQIVILREALNIFQGNELVIGIILSNWMLLTGAGAFLGRWSTRQRGNITLIVLTQLIIAVLPIVTLAGLHLVSVAFLRTGVMFSLGQSWLISLLMLIPFCLLSGALFTLFSSTLTQSSGKFSIGNVYGIESLGSIVGGLVFSLVLVRFLPAFQSLYILFWINLSAVILISIRTGLRYFIITGLAMGILSLPAFLLFNPDEAITGLHFPGQKIVLSKETPYGKIVLTEKGGQVNFYESGKLYFSSDQVQKNEETVHFAMTQHKDPDHILIVSGGISGTVDELQKYDGVHVDYLEINPDWVDIGRRHTSALDHENLTVISMDARKFIRNTANRYQVIIVDVPAPTTAQVNRYYTVEFFQEARRILDHGGIISLQLPSSANYMSPELIQSHSSLYNTMDKVFEYVLIIPGSWDFFLASDEKLSFDILEPLLDKGIENDYVNPYYYLPELTRMRSEKITEALDKTGRINTDLRPRAYFIQLNYWLSHFKGNLWYMGIMVVMLALLGLTVSNKINKALFISGFSGASMTFILIVCFQVLYGYVYQMTGVLITMFMGGLAMGSLVLPRILTPIIKRYRIFQFIIALLVLATPLVVMGLLLPGLPEFFTVITLNILSLLFGILIGYQFTQAAYLQDSSAGKVASSTYGVDLAGSTVGSLTTAILLVPLLGIIYTCIIVAGLNILVSFLIPSKEIKP